jgi:hypothetical protein
LPSPLSLSTHVCCSLILKLHHTFHTSMLLCNVVYMTGKSCLFIIL